MKTTSRESLFEHANLECGHGALDKRNMKSISFYYVNNEIHGCCQCRGIIMSPEAH